MRNPEHDKLLFRRANQRWQQNMHRDLANPLYRDEWYAQQCGLCKFFVRLQGQFTDWGGCANEKSPCDGTVRSEHDGCDAFEPLLKGGTESGTEDGNGKRDGSALLRPSASPDDHDIVDEDF